MATNAPSTSGFRSPEQAANVSMHALRQGSSHLANRRQPKGRAQPEALGKGFGRRPLTRGSPQSVSGANRYVHRDDRIRMRAGRQGRRPRRCRLRSQPRTRVTRPRGGDRPAEIRLHALRPDLGTASHLPGPLGALGQWPDPLHCAFRVCTRSQVLLHRAAFGRQLLQPRRLLRLSRRAHPLRLLLQGGARVHAPGGKTTRHHSHARLANGARAGDAL